MWIRRNGVFRFDPRPGSKCLSLYCLGCGGQPLYLLLLLLICLFVCLFVFFFVCLFFFLLFVCFFVLFFVCFFVFVSYESFETWKKMCIRLFSNHWDDLFNSIPTNITVFWRSCFLGCPVKINIIHIQNHCKTLFQSKFTQLRIIN